MSQTIRQSLISLQEEAPERVNTNIIRSIEANDKYFSSSFLYFLYSALPSLNIFSSIYSFTTNFTQSAKRSSSSENKNVTLNHTYEDNLKRNLFEKEENVKLKQKKESSEQSRNSNIKKKINENETSKLERNNLFTNKRLESESIFFNETLNISPITSSASIDFSDDSTSTDESIISEDSISTALDNCKGVEKENGRSKEIFQKPHFTPEIIPSSYCQNLDDVCSRLPLKTYSPTDLIINSINLPPINLLDTSKFDCTTILEERKDTNNQRAAVHFKSESSETWWCGPVAEEKASELNSPVKRLVREQYENVIRPQKHCSSFYSPNTRKRQLRCVVDAGFLRPPQKKHRNNLK